MLQVPSNAKMRLSLALPFFALAYSANAQDTLTLEEALRLARTQNGDVQAAYLDVDAAREQVKQSRASFLPTVTPSYNYNSTRRETSPNRFVNDDGDTAGISANWRLLDAGERQFALRATQESASATSFNALQTLRSILFTVHQRYYNTLRAQELLRVAQSQTERARRILDQTKAQVEAGEVARIQILQAEADLANAQVRELQARTTLNNERANLQGIIGWNPVRPMPQLAAVNTETAPVVSLPPLEELTQQGLSNRADLSAQRRRVEAQGYTVRRAVRESQISFGVDANFDQQLHPDVLEGRTISLNISLPWLDGGLSRSAARESRLTLRAAEAQLNQQELEARAEIQAAYTDVSQNAERVAAAQVALRAAQLNYEAAVESQRLGASDIIDVITAQVSLVTAESNFVEAQFDYQISEARLRLVTGQPIPGEIT
jgi:outer membrane protein